MALTIDALRGHLNMTPDEAAGLDGAVLPSLLAAATAKVEADLGFALTDAVEFPGGPPADVELAVLMLAVSWFAQREATVVGVSMATVPLGYESIVTNHRRWSFG